MPRPNQQPKIVSKLEYVSYLSKLTAQLSVGYVLCLVGTLGFIVSIVVVLLDMEDIALSAMHSGFRSGTWHSPGMFLLIIVGGCCGLVARAGYLAVNMAERMGPVLPLTRQNAAQLPEKESLLRASSASDAPKEELLRAASSGPETPVEQLLRPDLHETS